MTINANTLNVRLNSDSVCNLTELELLQVTASMSTLENNVVYSVGTLDDLPPAVDNTGRFIFVQSIQDYRYSDSTSWIRDYKSALAYNSLVWAWGWNTSGQLGDNTITSRRSPISVVGGFSDWCQVSASSSHTAAVRTNGTLWSWGTNSSGQLGDNTIISKLSPVSVVGGFSDWCQVSAGSSHTAAVRTNGTIWTWGCNTQTQLGDNTTVSRSSPVSVVGGFTDWCQISAGSSHTAAVRTTGSLWSWGLNSAGQLGDNSVANKSSPVSVVGGFTDWCQVSVSGHTAAVRTNGSLWAWGGNGSGQLGDNTAVTKSSPVSVVGGFGDWCQVSAGELHTAAVRTNGTMWTWGTNSCGQLGDNTTVSRSSPVSVVGGFTDWCQISTGGAVRTNGSLWTWGYNGDGRLGDNTIVNKSSPVSVVGGFSDWCQVAAGVFHIAAIRATFDRGF